MIACYWFSSLIGKNNTWPSHFLPSFENESRLTSSERGGWGEEGGEEKKEWVPRKFKVERRRDWGWEFAWASAWVEEMEPERRELAKESGAGETQRRVKR
jgi:hypothetical protein